MSDRRSSPGSPDLDLLFIRSFDLLILLILYRCDQVLPNIVGFGRSHDPGELSLRSIGSVRMTPHLLFLS